MLFLMAKTAVGQWIGVDNINGSSAEIVFKTSQSLFAISEEGNGVFKSSDNGANFERIYTFQLSNVEVDPIIKDVFVFGDTIIIGRHNSIIRSVNDGIDWQTFSIPENANRFFFFKNALYFNDALAYSNLYKSTDKGQTWQADYGVLRNLKVFNSTVYNHELYFSSYINKAIYKLTNNDDIQLLFNTNVTTKNIHVNNNTVAILGEDSLFKSHLITWNGTGLLDIILAFKANHMFGNLDTLWITSNDSIIKTYNNGQSFQKVNGINDANRFLSFSKVGEYEYINSKWGLYYKHNSNSTWNKSLLYYPIKYLFDDYNEKIKQSIIAYNPNDKIIFKKNIGEPMSKHFFVNNSSGTQVLDVTIIDTLLFGFNHNVGLYYSTDIGDSWTLTPLNIPGFTLTNKTYCKITKCNNEHLLIINKFPNDYYILRSVNAGNTWNTIYTGNGEIGRLKYSYFNFKNDTLYLHGIDTNGIGRGFKSPYINGQVGQFQTATFLSVEQKTIGSVMYKELNVSQTMTVQRSFDLGVTWERVGHGISYPSYAGKMYFCGNDSIVFCHINGDIYASKNKGYSWFAINDNLLNKKVSSIFLSNDTLYAATVRDSLYFLKVSDVSPRIVTGKVYFDNNNNTTYDETIDNPIPNVHIYSVSTGSLAVTDSLGNYELELSHATSNDTVRALNPFLYTNVTPSEYVINRSDTLKNFSFVRIESKNDLRVDITSVSIPRPGFLYNLFVTCKNEGSTTLDGNLVLNHNPFFQYLHSTITPAQVNQSSISWNFLNFEPLQSYTFVVRFRLDSTASIIGLPVQMSATIFPIIGDETPDNNTDSLPNIIVGSFDPNDKQVNRPMYLTPMQVLNKTEMLYTVRFQNTGTWYAEFVSILDTMHRHLDLSTFRVIAASHDYNFDFAGNGKVRFNFPDINLPDSNMNEPESHGFIKYVIRLYNNIPLNDSITNTAHIYFDYNEAIVTNTTLNIIQVDNTAVNNITEDLNILVYPNPARTQLNIRFEKVDSYQISMYSIDGRLVFNEKTNNAQHSINVESLNKGIYLLKISDEKRSKIVKIVIQ